jgi:malate dehydrogenase (oxaloacetate-decarboxylating)
MPENTNHNLTIRKRGHALLSDPILNKGLAFSAEERAAFGLTGLLPEAVQTLDQQVTAATAFLEALPTPLAKHIRLRKLQDSNETLFYAVLEHDLKASLPLVYTPTVGEACQKFSEIWERPRGLFLSYPDRDRIAERLADPALDDVRVIVVTDGERILGLGDQGAGGMGIPIGKLSLYTACAGIAPEHTLPIMLDCGTNNEERRNNPNYLGWRHERVRGADYDAFIDAFVSAVKARWPDVLLQWEDFAGVNAAPILEKYRDALCTFNDDIQGTAAVAAGAILAANDARGSRLRDQTIVMVGAGSAGVGIARLLLQVMRDEGASEDEARAQFFMTDKDGLLTDDRTGLDAGQTLFARARAALEGWPDGAIGLQDTIERAQATILIGVSGQGGLFTEQAIRAVAKTCDRPIIFPLSNPTSHAEATPEQIMDWTDGRALVSTGSPFPPLKRDGSEKRVDQTNNAYIFPGMGLGILACGATRVTETMFMAAARGLAALSPLKADKDGNLLPPVEDLRKVARAVAEATARQARIDKVCPVFEDHQIGEKIDAMMWTPAYRPYRAA